MVLNANFVGAPAAVQTTVVNGSAATAPFGVVRGEVALEPLAMLSNQTR